MKITVAETGYVGLSTATLFFDTSAVEAVIELVIKYNSDAILVIKSTIPVGYTASIREKLHCDNIIFGPEFCENPRLCMIIFILLGLLWAQK